MPPTCTPGTRKRVTRKFLQITSSPDKRKEGTQCREDVYELKAKLKNLEGFFPFVFFSPMKGNEAKEKIVPI